MRRLHLSPINGRSDALPSTHLVLLGGGVEAVLQLHNVRVVHHADDLRQRSGRQAH